MENKWNPFNLELAISLKSDNMKKELPFKKAFMQQYIELQKLVTSYKQPLSPLRPWLDMAHFARNPTETAKTEPDWLNEISENDLAWLFPNDGSGLSPFPWDYVPSPKTQGVLDQFDTILKNFSRAENYRDLSAPELAMIYESCKINPLRAVSGKADISRTPSSPMDWTPTNFLMDTTTNQLYLHDSVTGGLMILKDLETGKPCVHDGTKYGFKIFLKPPPVGKRANRNREASCT